jgi:SpoVK/Ycf46/Vps4 family AAA+-type ATPase
MGPVEGRWGPYETFESLVFDPATQSQLQKLGLAFLGAQDFCTKAKLPWRRGAFFFGPPGCGKSAATRGLALLLGWQHVTIPAYEILDTFHLTRALFESAAPSTVVVIDNIDQIFKRIDISDFFDIFDQVAEKCDGVLWAVTSRNPEDVPKMQVVRPGRFEESMRLTHPSAEVKKKFYETYLEPFMQDTLGPAKAEHLALLEQATTLTYAHLEEMRQLIAKVIMEAEPDRLVSEFQTFVQEQMIAGDRWGGDSTRTQELEERVKLSDPRLLISALQVTDAFKRVVEATVGEMAEAIAAGAAEGKST